MKSLKPIAKRNLKRLGFLIIMVVFVHWIPGHSWPWQPDYEFPQNELIQILIYSSLLAIGNELRYKTRRLEQDKQVPASFRMYRHLTDAFVVCGMGFTTIATIHYLFLDGGRPDFQKLLLQLFICLFLLLVETISWIIIDAKKARQRESAKGQENF